MERKEKEQKQGKRQLMTFLFLPVYTLCQQYTENRGWSRRNGIPHQMSGFWDNAGHRQITVYTQMGKVFHLTGELNLLLSCFGLSRHYSCKHLTLPAGPVSLNHGTVREWKIRLNLIEEASHPSLFPYTEAVHIIYI